MSSFSITLRYSSGSFIILKIFSANFLSSRSLVNPFLSFVRRSHDPQSSNVSVGVRCFAASAITRLSLSNVDGNSKRSAFL